MKWIICSLLLCVTANTWSQDSDSIPKYLFFLHNRFLENHTLKEKHDDYGRAEYKEIVDRFKELGFTVISEKRKPETNAGEYAEKVVGQIDSLKALKVPSENITVVGTSKGGYIAQYVSAYAKDSALNFVFVGGFHEGDMDIMLDTQWYGRILSIYESSDDVATSAVKKLEQNSGLIMEFDELKLSTGKKHGFLYKADDQWIVPAANWGKQKLPKDSIAPELREKSDLLKLTGAWTTNPESGRYVDLVFYGNSRWYVDADDFLYYIITKLGDGWLIQEKDGEHTFRCEWVTIDEVLIFRDKEIEPTRYFRRKS